MRALRPSRFAALRLAAGAPRAWLLEVELYSLVASFSKCNVIVRLQFDVRIIPNNVTSCESTRLRAATKTAWSAALGSTFCEWADAGYGCCFVIGHPCHFDRLRNSCAFRSRQTKKSETYVISTGSETDGLVFGLSPGPSRFRTARKRASRFIDPAHRCVLHGLHALEFRRPPPYISPILALESESTVAQWGLFRMRRCIDSGTRQYGAPA